MVLRKPFLQVDSILQNLACTGGNSADGLPNQALIYAHI